ncbi:HNH endonuclease [Virgibacillus sp. SK37]|uniref:HNH endonuclease n=1 Tax=Virgibacillus sp. SK37 TaxID=403957 RepID=UPI001E62DF3A|nr:HNH endonuclease signature motif containing protein [Virgibacillus sp. SK37]
MKTCTICGDTLPISDFLKKSREKWRGYCKKCNSIRNKMKKAKVFEVPELEKGVEIEVRGKMSKGHKYSSFVPYEKAIQLVGERVAYIVNPRLIRKYFDRETFRMLVFKRYGDRCVYCGEIANTIDHIIPKSKGGITSFSNCVPACSNCNGVKGNLDIEEYLYYYEPSTTFPGVSRTDSVRYSLLEITEKIDNINTYLGICLKRTGIETDELNNLEEMEELEEKVNELNETIMNFKSNQSNEYVEQLISERR